MVIHHMLTNEFFDVLSIKLIKIIESIPESEGLRHKCEDVFFDSCHYRRVNSSNRRIKTTLFQFHGALLQLSESQFQQQKD